MSETSKHPLRDAIQITTITAGAIGAAISAELISRPWAAVPLLAGVVVVVVAEFVFTPDQG